MASNSDNLSLIYEDGNFYITLIGRAIEFITVLI